MTTRTATWIAAALAANPDSTAADLATATGLGRSTVTKHLAALERNGTAQRTPGERHGARRTPDRWTAITAEKTSSTSRERLRPGQLDTLVLDHLATLTEPAGPAAVAKALGRSSGAVANCLARLAAGGQLEQVSERPRRYAAA